MPHAHASLHRSAYLDAAQRDWIAQQKQRWPWRLELPTWGLIVLIYGGWLATVLYWNVLGPLVGTPLLILLTGWYMSLQHELIHGHPTRFAWFNQLLGQAPLAVWYPYGLYRDSHLQHHVNEQLTLPGLDPESFYLSATRWHRLPRLLQTLLRFSHSVPGRLTAGPAIGLIRTAAGALRGLLNGEVNSSAMWAVHLALLWGLFAFLGRHGIAPAYYLAAVAYPALSLTMVRSLQEHRAAVPAAHRSVLNEAAWPWRLLFLNLNYHLVHHDLPHLPWYGLRAAFLARRADYIERSGGFVAAGYRDWFRRYWDTPLIEAQHPFADETHALPPPLPLAPESEA